MTPTNDKAPELRQQSEAPNETTQAHLIPAVPAISSPRELRLLAALLEGPHAREALDRRIGASNSPDIVLRLRRKGFGIKCEKIAALDRDGAPCRYGEYHLRPESLALARVALGMGRYE